jgi:hypothetical protein
MKVSMVRVAAACAVIAALVGCASAGRGPGPLVAFTFQPGVNPGITRDVVGAIDERVEPKEIRLVVPAGTDMHALVATFSLSKEAAVTVISTGKAVAQQSGVTPNDFSVPVTYSIAVTGEKQPWTYRVMVREAEGNARLSSLGVPQGTALQPAFSPTVHAYTLDVPFATTSVRLDVRAQTSTMKSVTVEGAETPGPAAAPVVDFASVQQKSVTIQTLAEDGVSTEKYTVTIRRGPPDTNALLANLELVNQGLTPDFNPARLSYRVVVPFETTQLVLRARPQSKLATMQLGSALIAGSSKAPALKVTGNPASNAGAQVDFSTGDRLGLLIVVTAEDQSVQQYLVDVQRAPPDSNNLLATLTLSSGDTAVAFAPPFNPGRYAYTVEVPFATGQVTITALPQSRVATAVLEIPPSGTRAAVTVTGNVQSKNGADVDFAAPTTRLVMAVAVTAQSGDLQRYTLDIRRGQPDHNADLGSLTVSAGTLSPAFSARAVSYTLALPAAADSVKLTVAAASPVASIAVAEQPGVKPAATQALTLAVAQGSATAVTLIVSAEDGTQKLYRVRITREAAPVALDGNALLQSLVVTGAQLAPAFDPSVILYDAHMTATTESASVSVVAQSQLATVAIDGQPAGKSARVIPVQAGATRNVLVDVTAQNGAVVRYTVRLARDSATTRPAADTNALLSGLKVDTYALQPAFDPSVTVYDVEITADDASALVQATAQSATATLTIDGQPADRNGRSIAVDAGTTKIIFIDVKAQSGAVARYSLRITRDKAATSGGTTGDTTGDGTTVTPVTPPPADTGSDHVLVTARAVRLQARELAALKTAADQAGKQARVTVRSYRTTRVITQYTVPVDVKVSGAATTVDLTYKSNGVTLARDKLVEVEVAIPTAKGKFLYYTEAQAADAEVNIAVPFLLYGDDPQVHWPAAGSGVPLAGYLSTLPLTQVRGIDKETFDTDTRGEYSISVVVADAGTGAPYGSATVTTKPGQGRARTLVFPQTLQVPEGATVTYSLSAKAKSGKVWSLSDTTQVWTTQMAYPTGFKPVFLFVADDLSQEK